MRFTTRARGRGTVQQVLELGLPDLPIPLRLEQLVDLPAPADSVAGKTDTPIARLVDQPDYATAFSRQAGAPAGSLTCVKTLVIFGSNPRISKPAPKGSVNLGQLRGVHMAQARVLSPRRTAVGETEVLSVNEVRWAGDRDRLPTTAPAHRLVHAAPQCLLRLGLGALAVVLLGAQGCGDQMRYPCHRYGGAGSPRIPTLMR